MTEGYPVEIQTDLRYYLDSEGRLTHRLRQHYQPFTPALGQKFVYAKVGAMWMLLTDHSLIEKGMIVRVRDESGFYSWRDDGDQNLFVMDVADRGNEYAIRTRKATEQEVADA